jgi:hypothetical protein
MGAEKNQVTENSQKDKKLAGGVLVSLLCDGWNGLGGKSSIMPMIYVASSRAVSYGSSHFLADVVAPV